MKVGCHLQTNPVSDPGMEWAKQAAIVKQMDGTAALRAAQPGAIKVFRKYFSQQPLSDPIGHAAEIVQALGGYHDDNLYVELYNECYQDRPALDDYITWTEQAAVFLHGAGYKVAGFGFSTGNPTVYPDAWKYLRSRGYGGVNAISMHEYWNGRTGLLTDWNALRHRQVHQWTGGQHPPFIISECGADAVEGGPSGWKLCGISAASYVTQLTHFEMEIEQDDYVLGAVVFGGSPTPDWWAFSTDGLDTSYFHGLPPRTTWAPDGANPPEVLQSVIFNHDADTVAKLEELGWTPKSDGVRVYAPNRKPTGTYQVECAEGSLIYAYATGEWIVRPN